MLETLLPALIPMGLSLLINIITICILVGLRKKAKTTEEKTELDKVIANVMTNGISSIKEICIANNIAFNKKEVKKVAAETIKEELNKKEG